jgi:DMSO/TMAO reductase YedYZ molybdopterin-dependent catalytic subunit
MPSRNSIVIAIVLVAAISATGLNLYLSDLKANQLDPVEVAEYQGERLGSISDFRENSIKGPQYVDAEAYRLSVTGLVERPRNYTYDEVLEAHESYSKVVTINCVEGWSVKILWEGVKVVDLLEAAGVSPDAKIVIFHAEDGYTSSLPLDYLASNDILMAHKMNDVVIPPERGFPFQLVAESKWGYKWVKWITGIEVSDQEDYRGFWESRGYNNDADLDESFFERRAGADTGGG